MFYYTKFKFAAFLKTIDSTIGSLKRKPRIKMFQIFEGNKI